MTRPEASADPDAGPPDDEVLRWVWRQQRAWSRSADTCRRRIDRARTAGLVLSACGAVAAVLAATLAAGSAAQRGLAVAAAVLVGLVPLVRRAADQAAVRAWTRARSVAEGIKAEVYAALAGGSAYLGDAPVRTLVERCGRILADADDLVAITVDAVAQDRPLPPVHDVDSYLVHRVDAQIEGYYRPRAAAYHRRLTWLRRAELALGALGLVLGALVATGGVEAAGPWVAVVTTVAVAIAAHAGAARYDHQVVEFQRTAAELDHLRATWKVRGRGPADLIDACEAVISVENQGWMARWHDDPEAEPPPARTSPPSPSPAAGATDGR